MEGFRRSPMADDGKMVLGPRGQNIRVFRPTESPGNWQQSTSTATDSLDIDDVEEVSLAR